MERQPDEYKRRVARFSSANPEMTNRPFSHFQNPKMGEGV